MAVLKVLVLLCEGVKFVGVVWGLQGEMVVEMMVTAPDLSWRSPLAVKTLVACPCVPPLVLLRRCCAVAVHNMFLHLFTLDKNLLHDRLEHLKRQNIAVLRGSLSESSKGFLLGYDGRDYVLPLQQFEEMLLLQRLPVRSFCTSDSQRLVFISYVVRGERLGPMPSMTWFYALALLLLCCWCLSLPPPDFSVILVKATVEVCKNSSDAKLHLLPSHRLLALFHLIHPQTETLRPHPQSVNEVRGCLRWADQRRDEVAVRKLP
mmetsp:Transcript_10992/g.24932  ORF Transcript_10992/g.24932 Transcript_10992/m.24932 type:complete len:262 (+) Transcript_10992:2199-2984(+)